MKRTIIIPLFFFFSLANAVNFISINGARRPGAPCSSRVSTTGGVARFNLPDIESDYYCFFASNSTANPMDFSNISGQSDPFLLLMELTSGDQNSLSTDFIGQSLVTSGVGKDVPDPFPTAGDAITLTNGSPSTSTPSVLSTLGTQTVVATTDASTPLSTPALPPADTAMTRIVAGTVSGGVAVALLVFFILWCQWSRRQKATKKETQPTPYPSEVEANGDQAVDSKLGLRMVSLEDQLRLLRQQITDIHSTPRSSLGESRTPSNPIGGSASHVHKLQTFKE
ncbi:hypothetical protein ONZ45_g2945 [Pleurotus djamor]|nr:hypothetical protein ONZ45_g2945 [Pleurotus djamor]